MKIMISAQKHEPILAPHAGRLEAIIGFSTGLSVEDGRFTKEVPNRKGDSVILRMKLDKKFSIQDDTLSRVRDLLERNNLQLEHIFVESGASTPYLVIKVLKHVAQEWAGKFTYPDNLKSSLAGSDVFHPEMGGTPELRKLFLLDSQTSSGSKITWREKDKDAAAAAFKKHRIRFLKPAPGRENVEYNKKGGLKYNPFNKLDNTFSARINWNAITKLSDANLTTTEALLY